MITTIELFSALCLSLITPNIGYVVNLVGTVCNPILSYILPCLFYVRAFPGKYTRYDLFIAYFVMISTGLIGFIGFILFWLKLFEISF